MAETSERPLLTFAIAAFNQEAFIREAVEAAFAQTYSPLEIVLSDDCSRDKTFDIMREMAAAYRGPHKIILNRNEKQKSIGGHVNRVVEVSHGELVVGAAGDDVSAPQRTEETFQAWDAKGRKATSIHSNFIQIDEDGKTIEQVFKGAKSNSDQPVEQAVDPLTYVRTLEPIVFGCAHTFSRKLFQTFGGLPEEVIHEDNVLAFRSILGGGLLSLGKPLVKYRLHGSNVYVRSRKRGADLKSLQRQEDHVRRNFRNREVMYAAFLRDLEKARAQNLIDAQSAEAVSAEASRLRQRYSLQSKFLESGMLGKFQILARLRRDGLSEEEMKLLRRRLVPQPLLLRMRLAMSYAAGSGRA